MANRVMTPIQVERVATALTTMAAVLNHIGFPWPDEAKADLTGAYEALGVEMPFGFKVVPIESSTEGG